MCLLDLWLVNGSCRQLTEKLMALKCKRGRYITPFTGNWLMLIRRHVFVWVKLGPIVWVLRKLFSLSRVHRAYDFFLCLKVNVDNEVKSSYLSLSFRDRVLGATVTLIFQLWSLSCKNSDVTEGPWFLRIRWKLEWKVFLLCFLVMFLFNHLPYTPPTPYTS